MKRFALTLALIAALPVLWAFAVVAVSVQFARLWIGSIFKVWSTR